MSWAGWTAIGSIVAAGSFALWLWHLVKKDERGLRNEKRKKRG